MMRLLSAIPVLIALSVAVFGMLHLVPGDPVMVMFRDVSGTQEQIDKLRAQLGLDDPLPVQYLRFASGLVKGDLGRSIWSNQPVADMIRQQFRYTAELTIAAALVAIILGTLLGVIAATRRGKMTDLIAMVVALLGVSVPNFFLSMILILIFGVHLRWLPVIGEGSWRHLLMPAIALGFSGAAILARMTRSGVIEAMTQDYIRTARAKGQMERVVVYRHALRNVLIPVVTIFGLQIGNLLAGAVIVETIFARRGIGRLLIESIDGRDFPVAQGVVFFIAVSYMAINLTVDLFYSLIDPRIRYS
jgi:peptide/nickel transport system permease protein